MQNLSVCLFHELLPIFASLYAFMSIMLLDNISLLKSKKAWIVTEVGNSGVHMYFLNSFMTPSKKVTKYCQQLSWYQPPSRWVSSSFLGVYDLYSYRTLKVTAEQFEKNLWSSAKLISLYSSRTDLPELFTSNGWVGRKRKKKSSFDGIVLFSEKLPWTAFINHTQRKKTLAVPGTAFICTSSSQHFQWTPTMCLIIRYRLTFYQAIS